MNDQEHGPYLSEQPIDERTQKLIKTFFQFHRLKWWNPDEAGFKRSEIKLIFMLKDLEHHLKRKVSVSDISNHLRVTSPSVTHLLNSLEEKGMVKRTQDELDRRSVNVELTEEGLAFILKAEKRMIDTFHGLIEYMGMEKSDELCNLIAEVSKYFHQLNFSESLKNDEVY